MNYATLVLPLVFSFFFFWNFVAGVSTPWNKLEFPHYLALGLSFSVLNEGVGHFSNISRLNERVSLCVSQISPVSFFFPWFSIRVCSAAEPNASEQYDKRLTVVFDGRSGILWLTRLGFSFFFFFALQRFHFEMWMMKDWHQTRRLHTREHAPTCGRAVRLITAPTWLKTQPVGGPEEGAVDLFTGTGWDSAGVVSVELLEVELALVSRMIVNL